MKTFSEWLKLREDEYGVPAPIPAQIAQPPVFGQQGVDPKLVKGLTNLATSKQKQFVDVLNKANKFIQNNQGNPAQLNLVTALNNAMSTEQPGQTTPTINMTPATQMPRYQSTAGT